MFATQLATATSAPRIGSGNPWMKALLISALFLAAYFLLFSIASAADGEEFADAATQVEQWVRGNLGKLAAMMALAIGSVVAAVKKDWSWLFGAIVLAIGIGIIVGVVNASFTATI